MSAVGTFCLQVQVIEIKVIPDLHDFLSSDFFSSLNFGQVTDIHTDYDAYEPTVHTHRWAQKKRKHPSTNIPETVLSPSQSSKCSGSSSQPSSYLISVKWPRFRVSPSSSPTTHKCKQFIFSTQYYIFRSFNKSICM